MADNVQWIKFKVGTFDGNSFKRIKRAKIEGIVDFRDKLTAVWFELLDLGGKVNNSGFLINDEIAFTSYEDIAIALDRSEKEIDMCINWFIKNNMMEIIDDVLLISNWAKYQNNDGLEKIRLQNVERQQRYRERQKQLALELKDNKEIDKEEYKDIDIRERPLRNVMVTSQDINEDIDISNSFIKSIKIIVDYLNQVLGTQYKYTSRKTQELIKARFNDGFTMEDFQRVIDIKYEEWHNDEKMGKFLRPETLFSNKFESYLNQKQDVKKQISKYVTEQYKKTGDLW